MLGSTKGQTIRFKPFNAWRPRPDLVAKVASPPYDVVTRDEAAGMAEGNPISFLHVGRSDIDLPAGTDPYDARVYESARASLVRLMKDEVLQHDDSPSVYLYEQVMNGQSQIGVVGLVHIDDYESDVIPSTRRRGATRKTIAPGMCWC
jgi:uncharacterized protein (DUF1015 family)